MSRASPGSSRAYIRNRPVSRQEAMIITAFQHRRLTSIMSTASEESLASSLIVHRGPHPEARRHAPPTKEITMPIQRAWLERTGTGLIGPTRRSGSTGASHEPGVQKNQLQEGMSAADPVKSIRKNVVESNDSCPDFNRQRRSRHSSDDALAERCL